MVGLITTPTFQNTSKNKVRSSTMPELTYQEIKERIARAQADKKVPSKTNGAAGRAKAKANREAREAKGMGGPIGASPWEASPAAAPFHTPTRIGAFPTGKGGPDGEMVYESVERQLVRSLCLDSYSDFVKEMWDTVVPEKLVWNWHMDLLCNEVQAIAERVIARQPKEYDLVVNVPPGSSKSTIFSIMLQPWMWARDPTMRFLNYSYCDSLALTLALSSRDVVESAKYKELFGGKADKDTPRPVNLRRDQAAKSMYMTEYGGSRFSCGAGGLVTGRHGHIQVIDDPIDPQSVYSQTKADGVIRWMKNTLPSRCVDKARTPTILVQQRLGQNDPSVHMIERKGGVPVRHICLPADISNVGLAELVKPPEAKENYTDNLLDLVRMSREVLEALKATMTPYDYACQFDQDPVPREGGMFHTKELESRVLEFIDWPNVQRSVRFWDKAASQGKGCFTAGCLMLVMKDGRIVIGHMHKGQWEPFTRESQIKIIAEKDRKVVPVRLEEEGGASGKFDILASVKALAGWDVAGVRPQGDKESRAAPFAAQVNGGNVWLVRGDWNHEYLGELLYFPNSKYRDQVDASSGAFNFLTGAAHAGTW